MPKERKSIEKLFKLVDTLNNQVANLKEVVKYLHKTLTEQGHSTHKPDLIDKLSEDLAEVKQHVKASEIDLEEVTKHVKEGEENFEQLAKFVASLEQKVVVQTTSEQFGNMGFKNSVSAPPNHSAQATENVSSADTSRPPSDTGPSRPTTQVRFALRPRICYNCRNTGHLAKECPKPNPRVYIRGEPPKLPVQAKPILKKTMAKPNLSDPSTTVSPKTLRDKYASNLSVIPAFKTPQPSGLTNKQFLSQYDPEWVKSLIAAELKEKQSLSK